MLLISRSANLYHEFLRANAMEISVLKERKHQEILLGVLVCQCPLAIHQD
jgi:hypothetical protein